MDKHHWQQFIKLASQATLNKKRQYRSNIISTREPRRSNIKTSVPGTMGPGKKREPVETSGKTKPRETSTPGEGGSRLRRRGRRSEGDLGFWGIHVVSVAGSPATSSVLSQRWTDQGQTLATASELPAGDNRGEFLSQLDSIRQPPRSSHQGGRESWRAGFQVVVVARLPLPRP
jgi:hypothetical protein